jgi:hypothetical protein
VTLVFYWYPAAPTSRKAALTHGELKAVFDADRVRHLASAAGGDTWWIERKGRQSVVKIPTSDYKLSWVDREVEGLRRGACDNLVRVESVESVTFSIGKRVVITFEYVDGLVIDDAIRTNRWPSPDQVRELLRGVLSGLAGASRPGDRPSRHEAGKPGPPGWRVVSARDPRPRTGPASR